MKNKVFDIYFRGENLVIICTDCDDPLKVIEFANKEIPTPGNYRMAEFKGVSNDKGVIEKCRCNRGGDRKHYGLWKRWEKGVIDAI